MSSGILLILWRAFRLIQYLEPHVFSGFLKYCFLTIYKNHGGPVIGILRTNGLDRVIAASGLMIFLSSILITYLEPNINHFVDGIWWSIVTTTTVGYGDISPTTIIGRVVAIFLMIVGIGLVGMITGSITTFFIRENKKQNQTVQHIINQLGHYEDLSANDLDHLIVLLKNLKKQKQKANHSSRF